MADEIVRRAREAGVRDESPELTGLRCKSISTVTSRRRCIAPWPSSWARIHRVERGEAIGEEQEHA